MPKFDVVIGNPPYQASGAKLGYKNMYPDFIKTGTKILKIGGVLAIVSPVTFLKSKRNVLGNLNISYLKIQIQNEYFPGIGSNICYFLADDKSMQTVVENNDNNSKSIIKNMLDISILPLTNLETISISIFKKKYLQIVMVLNSILNEVVIFQKWEQYSQEDKIVAHHLMLK